MDTEAAFGFEDLLGVAIGAMAKAVSQRHGEGPEQQFARCEAAVHMITGFLPRDCNEIIIAGHCVMVHEVMTDAVHDALMGETTSIRRGARGQVVALNKAFNDDVVLLDRYRLRPSEGRRDAPDRVHAAATVTTTQGDGSRPEPSSAQPESRSAQPEPNPFEAVPAPRLLNRAARREAARAEKRGPPAHAQQQTGPLHAVRPSFSVPAAFRPSREAVAQCRANPEAMAALEAGDPASFARALGIEAPGEAFLAAANRAGSPFDPRSPGPWPPRLVPGTPKA